MSTRTSNSSSSDSEVPLEPSLIAGTQKTNLAALDVADALSFIKVKDIRGSNLHSSVGRGKRLGGSSLKTDESSDIFSQQLGVVIDQPGTASQEKLDMTSRKMNSFRCVLR
mmetsp:Transcript_11616/g.15315  ORF Transcript_11616/g.15315 Transcript_11616/m.15315 type:complete len:111 (+) Transcript_11616:226-558(+)